MNSLTGTMDVYLTDESASTHIPNSDNENDDHSYFQPGNMKNSDEFISNGIKMEKNIEMYSTIALSIQSEVSI